jgi:hypothetical protein
MASLHHGQLYGSRVLEEQREGRMEDGVVATSLERREKQSGQSERTEGR